MGRHDSGYKLLFSHPFLVESLLRGFVPGDWIDRLDFDSLEPVSEAHPRDELGMRYDDVIWRLRWRASGAWVYVYLMLELQSSDYYFMAVRVLDYEGGLYRKIVRTLKPGRGDRLPIVFPVVLHTSRPAWTAPTEVFDLLSPAPTEVEPYLPHLRYLLLDVNAYAAEQLEAMRNPVACLLWLEGSREFQAAPIAALDEMLDRQEQAQLRHACLLWVVDLLRSRMPDANVPEVKKLEEVPPMIAENAIDWTIPWKEEGRREGRREGEAEGLRRGRREGEAAILLRQLTHKYGALAPDLETRVRNADADRLLDWGERFVHASSLDEIFNGKVD